MAYVWGHRVMNKWNRCNICVPVGVAWTKKKQLTIYSKIYDTETCRPSSLSSNVDDDSCNDLYKCCKIMEVLGRYAYFSLFLTSSSVTTDLMMTDNHIQLLPPSTRQVSIRHLHFLWPWAAWLSLPWSCNMWHCFEWNVLPVKGIKIISFTTVQSGQKNKRKPLGNFNTLLKQRIYCNLIILKHYFFQMEFRWWSRGNETNRLM